MNPCQSGFFSESPFFLTAGKSGAGFRRVTDTFRCSTPWLFLFASRTVHIRRK
jgi:hypothetical protein